MAVTVINGGQTTTLTNLVILRFDNAWKRWRVRLVKELRWSQTRKSAARGTLPSELDPGKNGTGIIRKRPDVISGSDRTAPIMPEFTARTETAPTSSEFLKPRSKLPPNTKPLS